MYHKQDWISQCTRRLMLGCHVPDYDQLPGYQVLIDQGLAPAILSQFDPRAFVRALKKARVQAFWFYNKCHLGNCYYPSRVPGAHVHSALNGRDLFGELVEACRSENIVPLCIYEFFDYRIMKDKPEWCCRLPEKGSEPQPLTGEEHAAAERLKGTRVGRPCLHGPYGDFALAQAVETVRQYPVQGYYVDFLGMLNFNEWLCPYSNRVFKKAFGFDFPGVQNLSHDQYVRYVRWHYRQYDAYAKKFIRALRQARPELVFVHNAHAFGHVPNLQSWEAAARNCDFLSGDHFMLGGTLETSWILRAYAAASRRLPAEALLDTTHGGDRYNPKALDSHRAEMWTARALNAAACSSICLTPQGTYHPACMELVRRVFTEQQASEPWLKDIEPVAPIGLVHSQVTDDFWPRDPKNFPEMSFHQLAFEGWCQALIQGHHLWGVVHDFQLDDQHLRKYQVIVLPEVSCLGRRQCRTLERFVRRGGRLIATGETAWFDELGRRRRRPELAGVFGLRADEPRSRRHSGAVIRAACLRARAPWLSNEMKYALGQPLVRAARGTEVWAETLVPLTHTPDRWAAGTRRKVGRGAAIYWAGEPGLQYRTAGQDVFRRIMDRTLHYAGGATAPVRLDAPGTVELFAHRQAGRRHLVVSLVNQAPGCSRTAGFIGTIHTRPGINTGPYKRFEELAEMPAIPEVTLFIRETKRRRVARTVVLPACRPLPLRRIGGECAVTLKNLGVHAMLLVEW